MLQEPVRGCIGILEERKLLRGLFLSCGPVTFVPSVTLLLFSTLP